MIKYREVWMDGDNQFWSTFPLVVEFNGTLLCIMGVFVTFWNLSGIYGIFHNEIKYFMDYDGRLRSQILCFNHQGHRRHIRLGEDGEVGSCLAWQPFH